MMNSTETVETTLKNRKVKCSDMSVYSLYRNQTKNQQKSKKSGFFQNKGILVQLNELDKLDKVTHA